MTEAERRIALAQIANDVRNCTNCRLHQGRTKSVPGEGNPDTEVMFVGEAPGFNEDREGRPFVGRAGGLLVKLLASIGWRREDVFITNVVKCRPPDNRDPEPDEIAACRPFLQRQLEALDPALVVTLGRHSLATFMPGARISQAHGTVRPVPDGTGAGAALTFAMYHPAAALRTPAIEQTSYTDIAAVPAALLAARERRERAAETIEKRQFDALGDLPVATESAGLSAAAPATTVEPPVAEPLAAEPSAAATTDELPVGEPSALELPEPLELAEPLDLRERGDVAPAPVGPAVLDLPELTPVVVAPETTPDADADAASQLTLF